MLPAEASIQEAASPLPLGPLYTVIQGSKWQIYQSPKNTPDPTCGLVWTAMNIRPSLACQLKQYHLLIILNSVLFLYILVSIILKVVSFTIKLLFLQFKWFVLFKWFRYKIAGAELFYKVCCTPFWTLALVAAAATFISFCSKN